MLIRVTRPTFWFLSGDYSGAKSKASTHSNQYIVTRRIWHAICIRRSPGGREMSAKSPLTAVSQAIQPDRPCCFDLQTISALSNDEIRGSMTKDELIQIIRSVDYPFAGKERLEFFDCDTLERVVCLIRRWSCRQLGKPTL